MLQEIWEPDLTLLFVGSAVDVTSDKLGFHHLHQRDRFWELADIGGITPKRIITAPERKALAEGHARGNLADPIRVMFVQKKTSELLRLGLGITYLNRRAPAEGDKDKAAKPSRADLEEFIGRAAKLRPKALAFTLLPEVFLDLMKGPFPEAHATLGPQPFTIAGAEVWLLGSPATMYRGEKLTQQEDAFFALGERIPALRAGSGS